MRRSAPCWRSPNASRRRVAGGCRSQWCRSRHPKAPATISGARSPGLFDPSTAGRCRRLICRSRAGYPRRAARPLGTRPRRLLGAAGEPRRSTEWMASCHERLIAPAHIQSHIRARWRRCIQRAARRREPPRNAGPDQRPPKTLGNSLERQRAVNVSLRESTISLGPDNEGRARRRRRAVTAERVGPLCTEERHETGKLSELLAREIISHLWPPYGQAGGFRRASCGVAPGFAVFLVAQEGRRMAFAHRTKRLALMGEGSPPAQGRSSQP